MTEKELIGKIGKLRQIKPTNAWVSLNKKEILGEEPGFTFFPYFKPALAGLIAVFVLFGVFGFGFVKNSLPGDLLYSIRKIAHKSQAVFVSEEDKPAFQLKLANDRLEDLTKAPAKNLAPTISEFQANISEAAKNLSKIDATSSDPVVIKKIVEATKELEESIQRVKSMGMVVGDKEIKALYKTEVEYLIEDLEGRILTEEKEEILSKMKELFEKEQYSAALELYLTNQ